MVDLETTLVEFQCELGSSILHPSNWEPRSISNGFTISHPNGQAVLSNLTFAKESGTPVEFGQRLAKQLAGVEHTEWLPFQMSGCQAIKWHSDVEATDAQSHWLLYVVQCGTCLHAIVVELIEAAAVLNWRFYEQLAQSFKGIDALPAAG